MPYRIALATTDRLTVYKHFGQAEAFHIVDIYDDRYEYADVRHLEAVCGEKRDEESAFDRVIALLSDCDAVVVGKIGPVAASYAISKGLRVFEAPGAVEKILEAFMKKKFLTKKRGD
jgi:predicted Fe-Mo cluster-binding NifX family protein